MSMTKTARKLELALNLRGDPVVLEEKRFWSVECKRVMTCYKVLRCEPGQKKQVLLKTWKLRDATLLLANLYLHPEVDGGG